MPINAKKGKYMARIHKNIIIETYYAMYDHRWTQNIVISISLYSQAGAYISVAIDVIMWS